MENITSEQELKQLLEEGRISEEEYKQLHSAMNKPNTKEAFLDWKEAIRHRKVPSVLWIALVSLGLMVFMKLAYISKTGPVVLVDAALSAALLAGLYLGHKWAYILTIAFVSLGAIVGFTKGFGQGITILLADCLVLVPVLLCTDYFFPKTDENHSNP
ncbi:MAG: hypothetical protein P8Z79_21080 [Sedimentisphaerales bacterium]